jgi:hypothetical protein
MSGVTGYADVGGFGARADLHWQLPRYHASGPLKVVQRHLHPNVSPPTASRRLLLGTVDYRLVSMPVIAASISITSPVPDWA